MTRTDVSGFAEVDHTSDPDYFVRFLDAINTWPFFQELKTRSLQLLDVQPGQHVLDVGCGVGDVVRTLAPKVGSGGRVVGIDQSATMLEHARRRSEELPWPIEYHHCPAQRLDFPAATFDRCRSDRVLIFLEDLRQGLSEIIRVTRPGGRIVISEFDIESSVVDSPYRAVTRVLMDYWCDTFTNGWVGRQLPGLFRELGLTDVTVDPMVLMVNDFKQVRDVYQWPVTVQRAQQAKRVSSDEATMWLRQLEEAGAAGQFFQAQLMFTVAGRKP